MNTDFTVRDEGSIYILTPLTDAAREWVVNNIPDDALMFGGVVVEHRYIMDIIDGIRNDELTIGRV